MPCYLLVDNGSKQPLATLRLRRLAVELSTYTGKSIHPVSLQHADSIPADQLGGAPAHTFSDFLQQQLQQGETDFIALPLFFGQSRALTSFIPDEVAKLQVHYTELKVQLAEVTYPLPDGDPRLAEIVHEHIQQTLEQIGAEAEANTRVVLVDHGSPSAQITAVRQGIAQTVVERFGLDLGQACMERREGEQYDFNGELLQEWLRRQAEQGIESVIIAMLFFLPGRHAGPCGDVEEICEAVLKDHPQLCYTITPLIGEHPLLLEILKSRLEATE